MKNTKTPQPNQSTSHSTKKTLKVTLLGGGVKRLRAVFILIASNKRRGIDY